MKGTKYLALMLGLALLIGAGVAQAADFRLGAANNGNIIVKQDEQVKNLYTAGNIVSVDANIEKNLHVAGNIVTIDGEVGHSIYSVVAGTLIINGSVGGSVHGAGSGVIISNDVDEDVIIGGGHIFVSDQAVIGGDLIIGGGTIDVLGSVDGDVYIGGGVVVIDGQIGGDVKINQADKIKISKNTVIHGNLEYNSKEKIEIEDGAVILGKTSLGVKKGIDRGAIATMIFGVISVAVLIKTIGLIIVGLLLWRLFKNFTEKTVKESLTNFWQSLGIGFAILVLIPVIAIIFLVTVVGLWLGFILGIIYILSLLLAGALAGIILGSLLGKAIKERKNYVVNWKTVVGGTIALMIIKLVPIIGWIVAFIFTLIALGALCRTFLKIYKS